MLLPVTVNALRNLSTNGVVMSNNRARLLGASLSSLFHPWFCKFRCVSTDVVYSSAFHFDICFAYIFTLETAMLSSRIKWNVYLTGDEILLHHYISNTCQITYLYFWAIYSYRCLSINTNNCGVQFPCLLTCLNISEYSLLFQYTRVGRTVRHYNFFLR